MRGESGGLQLVGSDKIRDGMQVWMRGDEVVDITTDAQASFYGMFGLMRVPHGNANRVMLSTADYDRIVAAIKAAP